MSRRVVTMVVISAMLVSIVIAAGMLWGAAMQRRGDFDRCPATCSMLIKHYGTQRATLKTHEGDRQCWQTCDLRFNQGRNENDVKAMKAFWMEHKATNLHTNQCAQACWRKFHKGSNMVNVASWRSEPRAVACAPMAGRATAKRP